MPKADLRAVATARLDDARSLIAAGRYDRAYYTCGYAEECAAQGEGRVHVKLAGIPRLRQGVRTVQERQDA